MLKDETRKKVLKKALVDKICPNKAKKKKKKITSIYLKCSIIFCF